MAIFLLQAKNGIPVHLKGGTPDKILFGITVLGCGIGFMSIIHMVYSMGFKKK